MDYSVDHYLSDSHSPYPWLRSNVTHLKKKIKKKGDCDTSGMSHPLGQLSILPNQKFGEKKDEEERVICVATAVAKTLLMIPNYMTGLAVLY